MAFRIDPDAVVLYNDTKKMHARLKKSMRRASQQRVYDCFDCVFGGECTYIFEPDGLRTDFATHLSWKCSVPSRSLGCIFSAVVKAQWDGNEAFSSSDINDKWIYGSHFPLSFTMDLHDTWLAVLGHVTALIELRNSVEPPGLFNCWSERILMESMGLSSPDDDTLSEGVSSEEALQWKKAVSAIQDSPVLSLREWPNLAPWLNAMQHLFPPPELSSEHEQGPPWQAWAQPLKALYLQTNATPSLVLPGDALSPDGF